MNYLTSPPNKRLNLAAAGLGKNCVCALAWSDRMLEIELTSLWKTGDSLR